MEDIVFKTEAGAEAPAPTPKAEDKAAERPAYLPEKFKTAEDLAKAYTELEKKLGAKPADTPAPEAKPADKAAEAPKAEDKPAESTENKVVKEELAKRKIDFDALVKEFGDNKALKDDSYKALEDAGIPRSVVDDYISGQVHQAEAFTKEIQDSVGGQETFNAMAAWAAQSLTPAELKAYNDSLDGGADKIRLAVTGLHARYMKETGGNPALIGGGADGRGTVGYRSFAEQMRDMQDSRYKTDPAFRQDVERKALASRY